MTIIVLLSKGVFVNKYHVLALSCVVGHAAYSMEVVKQNDWKAEQYKRNSELQYRAAMGALSRIEFKGNELVLDIGCGDGRVTEKIAEKTKGLVLGIDISPDMIKHAQENHKKENLSFELQDISKSKYPYELMQQFGELNKFNIITAFSSLSWIKDQQQAFTNIARMLVAHKGMLRAGLAHEDSCYLRARFAMHKHDTWKDFFVDYEVPYYPSNEEKVRNLLKVAGLKEVSVSKIEVPQSFVTRDKFIDWMKAIPAQLDRIPQERHDEFLNDIVDEYIKEVPLKENGSIELVIGALAVLAETEFDLSWL